MYEYTNPFRHDPRDEKPQHESLGNRAHNAQNGPGKPAPEPRGKRRRSAPLETVTYKRPRCPNCHGIQLRRFRSIHDQGDTTGLVWFVCDDEACGYRFKALFE